jgi:hypothetical protein
MGDLYLGWDSRNEVATSVRAWDGDVSQIFEGRRPDTRFIGKVDMIIRGGTE